MSQPSRARVSLPARYRVSHYLAGGGMASVWAAEDLTLGRTVAVKVMAAHLLEDPQGVERFQREARAAARVSSHPHVVTVYDVGQHEGRPFIVMELVEGGTVADRLQAGRVERSAALRWLRDAAAALDAAHASGIVHRDVKPGNLLLDGEGGALVADFGIARLLSEATVTVTGQLMGTGAYLSPEHVLGEQVTAAADRYSLGVVAYELLTGGRPFTASHIAAQARQHVDEAPDPPTARDPELPAAVDGVLARALAKAPAERWPTCTAMVDALQEALERPRRRPRRQPRRALPPSASVRTLAPAAVVLAVVAVLLVALSSSGGGGGGGRASRGRSTTPARHASPRVVPLPATALQTLASRQSQGYALIHRGSLSQGRALERTVASSLERHGYSVARCREPRDRGCLTYAFALFDIGHASRLLGDYQAATQALERRVQIDNAVATVRAELAALPAG